VPIDPRLFVGVVVRGVLIAEWLDEVVPRAHALPRGRSL
jgi:hypothetical protein